MVLGSLQPQGSETSDSLEVSAVLATLGNFCGYFILLHLQV